VQMAYMLALSIAPTGFGAYPNLRCHMPLCGLCFASNFIVHIQSIKITPTTANKFTTAALDNTLLKTASKSSFIKHRLRFFGNFYLVLSSLASCKIVFNLEK
jgi:hypothetical protein